MLNYDKHLREPMDMPDPGFPIKVHTQRFDRAGVVTFPHHWHEHLEFLFIESGEAVFECGRTPFSVRAGDLIAVNSNELHYGISASDDLLYYAIIADTALLHSAASDSAETKFIAPIQQNRLLFSNHVSGDQHISDCALTIIRELERRELGYELAVKAELYRLLALLLRRHGVTELSQAEQTRRIQTIERFAPVLRHIDTHYQEPIFVEGLAALAGLSRFHFSRLFKELTGHTVSEYVNAVRLDRADYMLRHTQLTVSEIAAATGFNDIYYFSRTFKKHKQRTPSSVRGF
ncbi:helix-turn-helix transcriptional regulator [Paenibacillus sonchi]|uniref:Helix-turn-helix transcriptional regulator n=1 Tax=Paenibacillus sonchi TaxID=373687 RepID=A0A974PFM0_9BACL|nr:AraC family transcriptional regulator [Paenibacillus sonchi]MCE3204024.1 AraC family transcriptional regulator [Paenibacillus sonchi]QQZ62508.1 helix-turn-helix transcriptional regulator [Paenibacillus sonchi]